MSHERIPIHMSHGRVPWRRWMQLRQRAGADRRVAINSIPLEQAASRISAPAEFSADQRQEAQRRLLVFCRWLNAQLRRPVEVVRPQEGVAFIRVFGCHTYWVSHVSRRLETGTMLNGRIVTMRGACEIGRPLDSPAFLRGPAISLGIIPGRQGDLFFTGSDGRLLTSWLTGSAYRLLLKQPAFRHLRTQGLHRHFRVPHDLWWIALASRPLPEGPLLDAAHLNLVWQHAERCRRVARENPQLLPVMLAFIRTGGLDDAPGHEDTVAILKKAFQSHGISNSAWRYFVRHGSRIFRPAWEACRGQDPFEVAVRYLAALDDACLPPPPPPAVARALIHAYSPHRGDHATLDKQFPAALCHQALRAGLLAAHQRRTSGQIDRFVDEFLGVCWWASNTFELMGSGHNGVRWAWMVKQWKRAEAERIAIERAGDLQWATRLDRTCVGQYLVQPINSTAALIREAFAMRNCLEGYQGQCEMGATEIYSVRYASNGKRIACIGFRFESGVPEILDAKGYANTPPSDQIWRISELLLQRLTEQSSAKRQSEN